MFENELSVETHARPNAGCDHYNKSCVRTTLLFVAGVSCPRVRLLVYDFARPAALPAVLTRDVDDMGHGRVKSSIVCVCVYLKKNTHTIASVQLNSQPLTTQL